MTDIYFPGGLNELETMGTTETTETIHFGLNSTDGTTKLYQINGTTGTIEITQNYSHYLHYRKQAEVVETQQKLEP